MFLGCLESLSINIIRNLYVLKLCHYLFPSIDITASTFMQNNNDQYHI